VASLEVRLRPAAQTAKNIPSGGGTSNYH